MNVMPMSDKTQRISRLILQQMNGGLDDSEEQELNQWLTSSEGNRKWYEQAMANKFYLPRRLKEYEEAEAIRQDGWNKIIAARQPGIYSISKRMAIAAAVLILFSVGAIYWLSRDRKAGNPALVIARQYNNDVPPGGNKAVLTLGNGAQIVLNDAKNGAVAQQGKANVEKMDSRQITYNLTQSNSLRRTPEILWNTLATPRGGQYRVVSADGSKVWLNASSSLRFPSSFSGKTRQVILTGGEAYFEVAKNVSMPFIVNVSSRSEATSPLEGGGMQVEVLGTYFDIMAYEDEKAVKATLLEGAIKVKSGTALQVLAPGQRPHLGLDGSLQALDDPAPPITLA